MFAFFVVIHILICIALVFVVLLQSGRGGGMAGVFGGGAAQTLFGGRGAATFLSKATAWLAVAFMVMSILLAVLSSRGGTVSEGLLQQRARQRAAQSQLPPSDTQLDPRAVLDSIGVEPPPAGNEAKPPDTPSGSAPPPGN
ncbi:MAG TPA: preprotein translocase subunit SecG [Candidatus Krumholzibacteria bacterium]|nr:preprotein translocase subunit SecG [Candidatus Krumholzibacteria bacterium]